MLNKRLTRDLVLVLIILAVAVITPVAYFASQARRDISEQYIHNASSQAVERFRTMAKSLEDTLGLMRDWGASGRLVIDNDDELAQLLLPIFEREPLLTGVTMANGLGDSFYIYRDEAGFSSRQVSRGRGEQNALEKQWSGSGQILRQEKTTSNFNAAERPWFSPALSTDDVYWTQPYDFFTLQKVGITASVSFLRKDDEKPVVVAFDMLLEKPFEDYLKLAPSDNSKVIIFRHDNKLYMPGDDDQLPGFTPMVNVQDALVRKVHSSWTGEEDLAGRVIDVFHEGAVWWCGFQPLDQDNRNTWICVMVPENDIIVHAGRRMYRVIGIGVVSLLVALGMVFWIVRRNRRPFEGDRLFNAAEAEASIRRLIGGGENRAVEFKSTMRMNLHTQKPGKEIELAWIKGVAGFLNTDGGVLLLGVTDDGEITGLERDVFENEDKCRLHFKNLISKHIGAEFSKYIRFVLVPMEEKTVGVVRCARAEEPVFLKDGNKEHFYIRNGPSSDELPVSQAINYIKHRKQ